MVLLVCTSTLDRLGVPVEVLATQLSFKKMLMLSHNLYVPYTFIHPTPFLESENILKKICLALWSVQPFLQYCLFV